MSKAIVGLLIIASGVFWAGEANAQDILVNPQNQKYLFSAGTDETQAFLYNPAYLGLYNRGGVLDGYYFYPAKGQISPIDQTFHDIGIFGQAAKFGLAYRNAATSQEDLNQYSIGLGLGNPGFAVGASLSLMDLGGVGSKWLPSIGIALQPDPYVSIGAAYHNFTSEFLGFHQIQNTANIGIGIRPFGDDFLTLNGDLILPEDYKGGYKAGVSLEFIPGLRLYGIYDASGYGSQTGIVEPLQGAAPALPSYLWRNSNSYSIGLSFNFGAHVRAEGASSYQSGGYAATYGRVMVTSQDMHTIIIDRNVAEIVIRGKLHDAPEPWSFLMPHEKTLLDYIDEIKKCGDDPSINSLILKIYPFSTNESFFALAGETQELADAVKYVREQGKKVYAYLADDSGVNELYLASAADEVYMAPVAFLSGYGIDFDVIRLKGLFDKLHISWNAKTAGAYKSTFHTFYTDSASPEQAKLIQGLIDDIYSQMLKQVKSNRRIVLDDSTKSEISGLISSRVAAQMGLIDSVAYYDQFNEDVNKEVSGSYEKLSVVDPAKSHDYETRWGRKPEIAVIGVYGTIMTGESSPPVPIPFFGGDRITGSETVAAQIRAAAADENVAAIVLRVNSGGGMALGSDEIYNAVKEAETKKPVVASFANVAASGGYYVAAGAKRIFAEPATLTGSIGVVIDFPVLTDFLEKDLGANVENYHAGENSDQLSPLHKWDEKDMKFIDAFLNETYTDFKAKVAAGRKLTMDRVQELAQGKVYTGAQALSDSLVDDLGGLDKAVQYAAAQAGVSSGYRVKMFTVPGLSLTNLIRFGAELLGSY